MLARAYLFSRISVGISPISVLSMISTYHSLSHQNPSQPLCVISLQQHLQSRSEDSLYLSCYHPKIRLDLASFLLLLFCSSISFSPVFMYLFSVSSFSIRSSFAFTFLTDAKKSFVIHQIKQNERLGYESCSSFWAFSLYICFFMFRFV